MVKPQSLNIFGITQIWVVCVLLILSTNNLMTCVISETLQIENVKHIVLIHWKTLFIATN